MRRGETSSIEDGTLARDTTFHVIRTAMDRAE